MRTAQAAVVSTNLRVITADQSRSAHITDRLRRYSRLCRSRLLSLPPSTNHFCISL